MEHSMSVGYLNRGNALPEELNGDFLIRKGGEEESTQLKLVDHSSQRDESLSPSFVPAH
jgi:hypothetical protein